MQETSPDAGTLLDQVKYSVTERGLFQFCLLEDDGDGSVCCLTRAGAGDHVTQFGMAASIKSLEELLDKDEFWNENSPLFHQLKHLGVFFPVRHKLKNFLAHVVGFLDFEYFKTLVEYDKTRFPLAEQPNKALTAKGDEIIKRYTQNWYCTRINMLLAVDMIKGQWAQYAKELKSCVGWQTPKYCGKVFRGALHSPLEIFMMSFKRRFYIPSFTSTSICPTKMILDPYPEEPVDKRGYQNVIFEIDTSEFPNFSTIILSHQSPYDERENLLSCYNIFSWQGFRMNKWVHPRSKEVFDMPIISLKIEDYEDLHDLERQCIIGPSGSVPTEWMTRRGEIVRSRNLTPSQMSHHLQAMWASYDNHFGSKMSENDKATTTPYPLSWLNATFDVNEEELKAFRSRPDLDNQAFMQLIKEQEQRRLQKK